MPAAPRSPWKPTRKTIGKEQLKAFHDLGVNRLSIGIQSFQERDLRFLKRTHGAAQSIQAIASAREAGFSNISIDLIIGLETQTPKSMELNFQAIERLRPAHVSVYILEGVPPKRTSPGRLQGPDDDERDAGLYFQTRRRLLELGYEHYEVSNYCLPGRASRHNLKYWLNQDLYRPGRIGRWFSARP